MRNLRAGRASSHHSSLLIALALGGSAVIGLLGPYLGLESIAAFGGVVGLWIFLNNRPGFPLAIVLAGFYYYTVAFDALGWQTGTNTTLAFYVLVTSSSLIGALRRNSGRLTSLISTPASLGLAAFFAWMLVNSLALTSNAEQSQEKIGYGVLLMLVPYLAAALFDRPTRARFISAVVLLGALGLLLAAVTAVINPDLMSRGRFTLSPTGSPLTLAYALGISAVFVLAWALHTPGRRVWFVAIAMIGGASLVIVLTGSRGPLLALALSSVTMVLSNMRGRRLEILLGLLVATVLIMTLAPLTQSWARFDRLADLTSELYETGRVSEETLRIVTSGRTVIWQQSLAAWRSSAIVGVGLGNDPSGAFAHNFAIEILTELGLVGMTIFLLFFGATVVTLRRLLEQSDDPLAVRLTLGLLAFAFVHMSFSGRIQTVTDLWLAAGLACGLGIERFQHNAKSERFNNHSQRLRSYPKGDRA